MQETSVGILAYGSLISDPGAEIAAITIRIIENVETPFCVEFARTSASRGGAPTLVPVSCAGAKVRGQIILVNASADEAADMLYRREIHQVGSGKRYKPPPEDAPNNVRVKAVAEAFSGINTVLYTDIAANIFDLTAKRLASLAIASVRKAKPGEDGSFGIPRADFRSRKVHHLRDHAHYAVLPTWLVHAAWFCMCGLIIFSVIRALALVLIPLIDTRLGLKFLDF